MSKVRTFVLLLMAALAVAACEQPIMGEAEASEDAEHSEANIILHLSQFEQEDFGTRTAADIAQICSRINIAVFDSEGTKVKSVSQKQSDSEYGTVAMTLASGTYQLVVIAHNGEGSATITSTEVVSFANNKVTDTFFYYGDFIVTDEPQEYDLTLTRAVAMFRLVLTDEEMPSNLTKMWFYYTGGSSTFSPATGYGAKQSRQTETRNVAEGVTTFEIYTMPHEENDVLNIIVRALDANEDVIKERTFDNVPITRNQVSRYTGSFFGNGSKGSTSEGSLRMTADPEWDSVNSFSF